MYNYLRGFTLCTVISEVVHSVKFISGAVHNIMYSLFQGLYIIYRYFKGCKLCTVISGVIQCTTPEINCT